MARGDKLSHSDGLDATENAFGVALVAQPDFDGTKQC